MQRRLRESLVLWLGAAGLYLQSALLFGLAIYPSALMVAAAGRVAWPHGRWVGLLAISLALGAAPFVSGLALCALVAAVRRLAFLDLEPGRFGYVSLASFRWATYNSLILLVRFTFMNFMRVTPLLPAFHRAMGARIGQGCHINTNVMADSCLLEIGDDTVIGGDVTLVCHSAEGGQLVLAPTKIGARVTIGIMAILLPGLEIGDGATIAANSVVAKGTKVPAGELWGGVPARRIRGAKGPSEEPLE